MEVCTVFGGSGGSIVDDSQLEFLSRSFTGFIARALSPWTALDGARE